MGSTLRHGIEKPFALVARIGIHHHHVGDLLSRLEGEIALLPSRDAEASQLHAGRALANPELDSARRHQVEHRDRLRGAGRWVVVRDDLADPEADPDLLGLRSKGGEKHIGSRAVGVLIEEVMLDGPGVVDTEIIGQLDLLDGLLDQLVLGSLAPRLRQLQLIKNTKSHDSYLSIPRLIASTLAPRPRFFHGSSQPVELTVLRWLANRTPSESSENPTRRERKLVEPDPGGIKHRGDKGRGIGDKWHLGHAPAPQRAERIGQLEDHAVDPVGMSPMPGIR